MTEQPAPEPQKAKADAAPKPASSPSRSDPAGAEAYVPRPGQAKGKSRGILALAALVAAGALAGTALHFRAPSGLPPIAAVASENKVLTVTDADINVAATEALRKADAPAAAAPPAPAEAVQSAVPGAPIAPAAPAVPMPAASPLPVVPPELLAAPPAAAPQSVLTPQGQTAVRSEGYSIFSMRLIDNVDQDGDVVQISIDGVPMSYLSLTHAGATLEIPLKKGESHRITVTAAKDGVGGVTLGLQTSAGTIMSRTMLVGESDSWTIDYK